MCSPWQEAELALRADADLDNPYVDAELEAVFVHEDGLELRRPGFWDGGSTWRVRFAPTLEGRWDWTVRADAPLETLDGSTGTIHCTAPERLPDSALPPARLLADVPWRALARPRRRHPGGPRR